MNRREKYLYMFGFWVVITFVLTSVPKIHPISGISHMDKIAHFLIYGISGFLFSRYLREGNIPREMIFIHTVLLMALIGGVDEIHQRWIAWRVPSLYDLIADVSGAMLGSAAVIVADMLKFFGSAPNNE